MIQKVFFLILIAVLAFRLLSISINVTLVGREHDSIDEFFVNCLKAQQAITQVDSIKLVSICLQVRMVL